MPAVIISSKFINSVRRHLEVAVEICTYTQMEIIDDRMVCRTTDIHDTSILISEFPVVLVKEEPPEQQHNKPAAKKQKINISEVSVVNGEKQFSMQYNPDATSSPTAADEAPQRKCTTTPMAVIIHINNFLKIIRIILAEEKKTAAKMIFDSENITIQNPNTGVVFGHLRNNKSSYNLPISHARIIRPARAIDHEHIAVTMLSTDLVIQMLNMALCSSYVHMSFIDHIWKMETRFELGLLKIEKVMCGQYLDMSNTSVVSLKFLKILAIVAMFLRSATLLFTALHKFCKICLKQSPCLQCRVNFGEVNISCSRYFC